MGSIVQLLSNPPRYGVIQWIGTLPGILEGRIAGVELVSLSLLYIHVKLVLEYVANIDHCLAEYPVIVGYPQIFYLICVVACRKSLWRDVLTGHG